MVQQQINVKSVEHKVGNKNNPYIVVETAEGKMTCFDAKIGKAIEAELGGMVLVDVDTTKKEDKTYMNIRGFVQAITAGAKPSTAQAVNVAMANNIPPTFKTYKITISQTSKGYAYYEVCVHADDDINEKLFKAIELAKTLCNNLNSIEPVAEEVAE